ncbi:MAG: DUF58 domain-containing protein [Rickettsiales bacterium]|nr:DUF58 domain-containing protein [Rickettsiales bacterium]
MLYPNFKQLIKLESLAKLIKFGNKSKPSSFSAAYNSSFKGQGLEFSEVRNYNIGDDIRKIDWRVSAKLDDIFIKIFNEEKQRNVVIAIDKNDYMNFGTRGTFKNIVTARIASIISFVAHNNKDKIGFYIFGNQQNRFNYLKPSAHKFNIFRALKILCSKEDFNQSYSIEGAVFNLRRMGIKPDILFIISDFRNISEVFEKNVFLLGAKTQKVFINISDDSDFFIPDVGKIVLKYGFRSYVLNSSDKRGMKNYLKNFNEKQEMLKKISNKFGIKLININTKEDEFKVLLSGLKK